MNVASTVAIAFMSVVSPNTQNLPEPIKPAPQMILPAIPALPKRKGEAAKIKWDNKNWPKGTYAQFGSTKPTAPIFQPPSQRSSVRPSVQG